MKKHTFSHVEILEKIKINFFSKNLFYFFVFFTKKTYGRQGVSTKNSQKRAFSCFSQKFHIFRVFSCFSYFAYYLYKGSQTFLKNAKNENFKKVKMRKKKWARNFFSHFQFVCIALPRFSQNRFFPFFVKKHPFCTFFRKVIVLAYRIFVF